MKKIIGIEEKRVDRIKRVVASRQNNVVLVLEDIHDPHNAEAILRSCDAFGIQHVYFIFEKETPYNPKKVGKGTSSSANKWLDYHLFRSTKKCFSQLKKEGFTIYATVAGEGQNLFETRFRGKVALVVGNEHEGVSQHAINLADKHITIHMRGMVKSFNVSVAAALVLFEITRQYQGKRNSYSKAKQKKIVKDFISRARGW